MSFAVLSTHQATGALVQVVPAQREPYPLMTPKKLPSGCVLDYVNVDIASHSGSNMGGYVLIKAKDKSRGRPENVARVQATFDV